MDDARPARRDAARALYLEPGARGVRLRIGRVPASMPEGVARSLMEHVALNRAELREILLERRTPDVEAVRQEAGAA